MAPEGFANKWKAGVEIEKISKILGHENTQTTILCLGLNLEDMNQAICKLAEYEEGLGLPPKGHFSSKPVRESGPNEIWFHQDDWISAKMPQKRAMLSLMR